MAIRWALSTEAGEGAEDTTLDWRGYYDIEQGPSITPECSNSSLNTACALTNGSTETFTEMGDQDEDDLRQCWRPEDLEKILLGDDKVSISRISKFGLIHDRYARLKGLHVFSAHQEEYLPVSKQWGLGLSRILNEGNGAVATDAFRRSGHNFTSNPFKEFVREASGIQSDSIEAFYGKYERLSIKLYYDVLKAPKHRDVLLELKTILERIESDPFIITTIEHTWQTLLVKQQKRRVIPSDAGIEGLTKKLNKILDRVIINPLQQLLGKPSPVPQILKDLEVLTYRFHDYYCMASQVDWDSPFDTNIYFLEQIRWGLSIPALAEAITKQDQTLFSLYITVAFTKNQDTSKLEQARSSLNRRWSSFSNDIKYCLAARIDVVSQVDQLAQAFYLRRNYYSLTAIINGVKESGLETDALREFGKLIDFAYYRQNINTKTQDALHFLSPAIFDFSKGKIGSAQNVISASASYTSGVRSPGPLMKFKPQGHNNMGKHGSSHQHGTPYYWFHFVNPFFACFGGQQS
ncbi:uncharacterized protein N7498_001693 [Penicillium cinerascens]|uniref:Uncharacterized protein n=1 Tax=Penicillium cinerascens TaxID=70096 RepID=A0A9W9TAE7_9EURO|nr:uncharacterized protein N7498_001693 [Penicillium cinerascens]KAJ5215286.1 hypothetical protein N7498_001693 [Penicillium cinerascens]